MDDHSFRLPILFILHSLFVLAYPLPLHFPTAPQDGSAEFGEGGKARKMLRLCEKEVIVTTGTFEFADGAVTISERETHELYRAEMPSPTRLIIGDAIERTKEFVSKARAEFTEMNSVLSELAAR